jgi:hypothetical protein
MGPEESKKDQRPIQVEDHKIKPENEIELHFHKSLSLAFISPCTPNHHPPLSTNSARPLPFRLPISSSGEEDKREDFRSNEARFGKGRWACSQDPGDSLPTFL